MKKNSLLKVILMVLGSLLLVSGALAILGYFVPALEGKFTMISIGEVLTNFVQSFAYFVDVLVYLLIIGAFYGVLSEIPAYKKLLENITVKVKSFSKILLVLFTVLFALGVAFTGQIGVFLVFVPFVVAILLGLGYDKLVAISSTVVAMLVGLMSGLYVTLRNPNNYYGYSLTTFEGIVGAEMYSNLWPKLVLLVLSVALLVFFILRHVKSVQNKRVKYELNESKEIEVSEVSLDYKDIKTWPIIAVLATAFVLLILGHMPWNTLFGIECFDKFNEWLLGIKIGDFVVFKNLISNNIFAFGNWTSGFGSSYMATSITLVVFTFVLKLIYRVKFSDMVSNFVNGTKRILPAVLTMLICYTILVCSYNHGFVQTIMTWLNELVGINVGTTAIVGSLGTLLHSDMFYTVAGVLLPMMQNVTDESMYPTCALTFQAVYGVVSMVAPTSLFVVFAVKYFDVPYISWVKYIWRFILMLFLLVLLVLLVLALI